jgi:hypothetical protein
MAATALGMLGASGPRASAAEEQVVGPVGDTAKYVVSPRGVHLATVAGKGSRLNVIVDDVAGPKFDEILTLPVPYVDPRPFEAEGRAAGTMAINVHPIAPVTFSRDGKRFAYVARLGQEWVLMADTKEVLRLPVTNGADLRLEFTGDDGKHLLFARSVYAGYELWVDGQKWPGYFGSGGGGTEGTIDPLTSPDGMHIAYVASMDQRGEKRALIVDGKDAGYLGDNLQFTADSKHLLCINRAPKGQAVLIDGKSLFAARQILHVHVPPAGNRFIFVLTHFSKDGNSAEGSFLLVDGKPVETSLTPESDISTVVFSSDGKHYAAVCGKAPNRFVVIDGKKGQEYFTINERDLTSLAQGITFTPDSSKVVYLARTATGQFFVINDEESEALQNPWFQFSADGKRLAYGGMVGPGGQKSLLSIDGKVQPVPPGFVSSFTFSPDGSHYAFVHQQGGNKGIYLDGKNTELNGDFAFSPDGSHLAVVGFRPVENKSGLFVDGQLVFESYDKPLLHRAFTPDSHHLYWLAREPATGTKAAPGIWEYVVYVDGKAVARCDDIANAQGNLRNLYGMGAVTWKTPAAWNVGPAGQLTFLGPVDEEVKRFMVAPADSNIEAMVTEAKAAPARAAAKAAEDKKKADEAAAARKAKAETDAAAAAAQAKADYNAAVAKRQADYDAAIAKRKADYDAAVAKKKADYDAAVAARAEQLRQQQQKK